MVKIGSVSVCTYGWTVSIYPKTVDQFYKVLNKKLFLPSSSSSGFFICDQIWAKKGAFAEDVKSS